jgi:hypothetical protein
MPSGDGSIHLGTAPFVLLVLALLVTIDVRLRPYCLARSAAAPKPERRARTATSTPP